MMAFSPVAPSFAPAFSIIDVATLFVPRAIISMLVPSSFLIFSVICLPIPPPWPSITAIFIDQPPQRRKVWNSLAACLEIVL
jgi:hypothetical protein